MKLSLNRETLRQMSPAEAEEAVGGTIVQIQTRFCTVVCTIGCPIQTLNCTFKISCICPI